MYSYTQQNQKNMKEAVKLHMVCISSNNATLLTIL